jgi:hypothetical protein
MRSKRRVVESAISDYASGVVVEVCAKHIHVLEQAILDVCISGSGSVFRAILRR